MTRYVLVGSGAAALAAAEAIRSTDPRAHITMVSREPHPFYSRPGLAYYLTGELPERALELRSPAELRELRIQRVHAAALRIDPAAHRLELEGRPDLAYDRLLIATGARSDLPAFEGASLTGVLRLDALDDARRLLQLVRRGSTAVVVGGGITALELVEAFAARKATTHYFLRGDRYWPRVLDSPESGLVEARLEAAGVKLHFQTELARAEGVDGQLTAVETKQGERIACDLLAVAVGVRPVTELAAASGLHVGRGIVVDEYLRTSAPDVFAAGDVAEVHVPGNGAALLDTLWSTATAQGRAAGRTMAGASTPYLREPALNITRLAGIQTTIIGQVEGGGEDEDLVTITRGQSERWRAAPDGWSTSRQARDSRVRVVLGPNRIAGAIVMGTQELSRPLVELVRAGVDASALRDSLVGNPGELVPLLLEFHRSWEATRADRA